MKPRRFMVHGDRFDIVLALKQSVNELDIAVAAQAEDFRTFSCTR